MKSGWFFLPFLALFVGAIGTAVGSSFTEINWVTPAAWACAAALVALWISLDSAGFKRLIFRKGARYGASQGATIVLGLLVIVGVANISNRPRFNKSYDVTEAGLNTLADQSLKVADKLLESGQKVQVTAFFQQEEDKAKFKDIFDLYQRRADAFSVEYVDPQEDPTKAMAMNITSGNTVVFKLGEQEARITHLSEEKITNAIVKIMKTSAKSVYFLTGHGEAKLREKGADAFDTIVTEMENNRYTVNELSLLSSGEIPGDADMIVVGGPKYELRPPEIELLREYLKKGGALLVMADAMTPVTGLNSLLGEYGLRFESDLLILRPDDPRAALLGQNNAILSDFDETHGISKDFANRGAVALLTSNTRSLAVESENSLSMTTTIIGKSDEAIIKVKGVKSKADLGDINEGRIEEGKFPVIAASAGKVAVADLAKNEGAEEDKKDVAAGSLSGDHKPEVRLVAVGSSQFATNMGAQRGESLDLFMNIANYLMQDEDFISIRPKEGGKGQLDMSSPASNLSLAFISFIYPFIFLGAGLLYWFRRRKL